MIRSSYNDAKEKLMERFGLSDDSGTGNFGYETCQTAGTGKRKDRSRICRNLWKKIDWYQATACPMKKCSWALSKDELLEIKEKFGDERRTEDRGGLQ